MDWTPERVEELKALHTQGLTASQSALHFHVTRNAIIGAWHRNGLSRGRQHGTVRTPRTIRFKAKKAVVAIPEFIPNPEDQCSLLDLRADQCHWPYGDAPYRFCGSKRFLGSYCSHHHQRSVAA